METNKNIKEGTETTTDQINQAKKNIGLILRDKTDDYILNIKENVEVFAENLSTLFKKYDEESRISVISIFEEKDEVYINKINDSHLHYVFKINDKCVAILSLDYLSIKSFITMLLQIKALEHDIKESNPLINEVTITERSLLTLIIDMVGNALKASFNITTIQNIQVSNLFPYIAGNQIAITEISLGNSKGSIALILEPDFIKKSLITKKDWNTESIKKGIENLKVEMKFSTGQKTITLNYLNHLKEEDTIMFDGKINITVNNKVIGIGEIGHMGEHIAIMCTNFNRG